jgi:hypothetical protein
MRRALRILRLLDRLVVRTGGACCASRSRVALHRALRRQ